MHQALVIYILALILGTGLDLSPLNFLGVMVLIALGSALYSTFSLIIACIVLSRDRFIGIGQVLTNAHPFRQQRHLPHRHHARVTVGHCPG